MALTALELKKMREWLEWKAGQPPEDASVAPEECLKLVAEVERLRRILGELPESLEGIAETIARHAPIEQWPVRSLARKVRLSLIAGN